jgi:hypothetical protein
VGWSIYYELAWDAPLDEQVRARVASIVDAYNARRGENSEPLALDLDGSPARGAVKIHYSSAPEDDYRALTAALAAIADALPATAASMSDEYWLLTGADPRHVRIDGEGRRIRAHDESVLPPPRDAPPDVLREALRRAELVAARAKAFTAALAEQDLVFRDGYPQDAENGVTEALGSLEQWLRAHGLR